MDNETVYLPGKIRDRIQDLMKSRKVTQAELAAKIGCSESALSRFISGKTDKLGDESIIRIARAFEVSTDFLLGEVDEPDRKNYDISELGLSVEAARNLYTQKVNPENRQLPSGKSAVCRYHIPDRPVSGQRADRRFCRAEPALFDGFVHAGRSAAGRR